MKQKQSYRRTDDALWKGLLENIFDDFLNFFFPDARKIFDIEKGFTYLDKELADLFPADDGKAPKHVDKLVRVYMLTGEVTWILVHIEVQRQKDKDFAFRMFTYYYRILDRYRVPITAVAIMTDSDGNFHPTHYKSDFMGTGVDFYFNTYKVLEQDDYLLSQNDNPFAVAVLTALSAIKGRKLDDEKLYELKYKLLRNLYRRNISQGKIDSLLLFLQLYLRFENTEFKIKFEKAIEELTDNKRTMGIREFVMERAKNEGEQIGMSKKEEEKNLQFAQSLIKETDFSDKKIAELIGVNEEYILKVRGQLS